MQTIISLIQIFLAIAIVAAILLQAKGSGLSATFGGSGMFYRSRRGIENLLFYATILLAGTIGLFSIMNILLAR